MQHRNKCLKHHEKYAEICRSLSHMQKIETSHTGITKMSLPMSTQSSS